MEGLEKFKNLAKNPSKGIHSKIHLAAKEISEFCGEPKKFGMYLGIVKRIGPDAAYMILSEMKQSNLKEPAKFFMWKTKKENLK